jgi:hypothetical protein
MAAAAVLPAWITCSAAPSVAQLVNEFDPVNYSNILAHALYTRQGMNRFAVTGAQHDFCREAIYNEFIRAGLTPRYDWFYFQDESNVKRLACNVVAVKPGVQNPEGEVYVAGGHYDSKSNPGADDNATGVAAILEMARIFSKYQFAKTMVFVAFDCEEIYDLQGSHRLGSLQFVEQNWTDNIAGMISVDMIGWRSSTTPDTAWIYSWAAGFPVTNALAAALKTYGGLSVVGRTSSPDLSDHVAFHNTGVPACLLIESSFSGGNPFYHKIGDFVEQPNYINWDYVGNMARGTIGYFAEVLQPVDVGPTALSLRPQGAGLRLSFTGLPGCGYAVESATNLAAPVWGSISTNTAAADGSVTLVDDSPVSGGQQFFRVRFGSGVPLARTNWQQVIDNTTATVVGTWSVGTSSAIVERYHWNYRFASPGTGQNYVEFRPTIRTSGYYQIYEWHSTGSNRTTEAPLEINSSAGTETIRVNQRLDGARWNLVGTFYFNAGTGNYVRITDGFSAASGSVVMADAIKFVQVQ